MAVVSCKLIFHLLLLFLLLLFLLMLLLLFQIIIKVLTKCALRKLRRIGTEKKKRKRAKHVPNCSQYAVLSFSLVYFIFQ